MGITVLVCVKPVSPVTTPHVPSFLPLLEDLNTQVSWLVWTKKMPTSVTKPNPNVVFFLLNTQLSTVLLPTGTIWKKSGTTLSTTNFVSHQKNTQFFLPKHHLTQKPIVNV